MQATYPKVFFATGERLNDRARFLNFSDRGALHFESGALRFEGRRRSFSIEAVQGADLTYPRFPWISVALCCIVMVPLAGLALSRSVSETIALRYFALLPIVLSAMIPAMIVIGRSMLWIEVRFLDDAQVPRRAYFHNLSGMALGGNQAATLRMYRAWRAAGVPAA